MVRNHGLVGLRCANPTYHPVFIRYPGSLMVFDAIAEIIFRTVGEFVVDVLVVGLFYRPGWFILRIVTLGRYAPLQTTPHNR